MINIEGYKVFYGGLTVKPVNGNEPFTVTGDWLYKPEYDCWYGGGRSYPADICEAVEVDRVAELEKELSKQTALAQNGQSAIDTNMRLAKVIVDLQSRHKEAMELLEAAYDNAWRNLSCKNYGNHGCARQVGTMRKCLGGDGDWKWQHADRYEALKAQENK